MVVLCLVPCPRNHLKEKKAKEDIETYEEATNRLSRLLDKHGEGKNRYQNLHRMISSRTYPIKRAGQGEKVQKKAEHRRTWRPFRTWELFMLRKERGSLFIIRGLPI